MFTPLVRIFLISAALCLGIYLSYTQRLIDGLVPFVAGLVLLWSHFRCHSVWLAFKALKRGDLKRADNLTGQIQFPNALNKEHLAYYHWIRGACMANQGNLEAAEKHFCAALEGKLRTPNDRAIVAISLAELALKQDQLDMANTYLQRAESEEHSQGAQSLIIRIKDRIEKRC